MRDGQSGDDPTLGALLRQRALTHGDRVFLRFGERAFTFAEIDRWSDGVAVQLAGRGVRARELVPLVMPNRPEFVAVWFALAKLGAVATFVNCTMRGPALAHALNLSGAAVAIVDDSLVGELGAVRADLHTLRTVVATGHATAAEHAGFAAATLVECCDADRAPVPIAAVGELDPAMVLFTSGTTGPSKGCVLSHRYVRRQAELLIEHLRLRSDDVLYCPFPLFHLDGSVLTVMPTLLLGTTAAIGARFSVTEFWNDVRRTGATVFDFMGATLTLLHKSPANDADADNRVRLAWGVPVPEFADEFERRFGLQLVELYGSTDAGIPIFHPLDEPRRQGACGKLIDQYEARIVGPDDIELAAGEVGELVLRANEPSIMSSGYHAMPEATLAANRNGWFHTGDLLRVDGDGYFSFVGRLSDSIRRRGENISAFEVEEVIKLHDDVLDAAAFGVPSELTEEDLMVAVVARPGRTVNAAALIAFCAPRMAAHMLPRYVDIVTTLPRTATEKVAKTELSRRGITPSTWDRTAPA